MQEKTLDPMSIRYVKGVGPKKAEVFNGIGVTSVQDLFYYLPRRYEDRGKIFKIRDLRPQEEQAFLAEVVRTSVFRASTGTNICEVTLKDDTGRIVAVWYNMPFMRKAFVPGQKALFYGRIDLYKRLQVAHPVFEVIDPAAAVKDILEIGRIVPVYSLTAELSQKYMRKTVHGALSAYLNDMKDVIPTQIMARRKLVDLRFAIENIHFPASFENLERAYRRLVFEEFFVLQALMAVRRHGENANGLVHSAKDGLLEDFKKLFDFELTPDQKKSIADIERDMAAQRPMNRLVQGDVGSGKTVVAMYAMILAANNGYQSVLLAPTEILARQHYVNFSKTTMPLGLNIRLLVSGIDTRVREEIKKELSDGACDILIGTHSVFQKDISYKNLGLMVVDEQHKFGVGQREALKEKGPQADILVMSATPIPRSLALTVYGDMDITLLKGKPLERKGFLTYWVNEEKRKEVYAFMREEIEKGRQCFVVCPRVRKKEEGDRFSVESMYGVLKDEVFRDKKVACIHGQVKTDEKDDIMKDFRAKKYDILVATTVVEVGVDIPNASVMVVEEASRYGLAQLHQLRGRIGRGEHQSYCILIGDPVTEVSGERLSVISEIDDGFLIAEKDLDIRGPGEFFGTRQSGLPELKVGDIIKDLGIMEEARHEAFELVKADPSLADPRHLGLKRSIIERFRGKVRI